MPLEVMSGIDKVKPDLLYHHGQRDNMKGWRAVMFQLQLVQLTGADREREIEADLRRRQLLKAAADVEAIGAVRSGSGAVARPSTSARRVPAIQR